MTQRIWYTYTHETGEVRRVTTYAGVWRWGKWRFRHVGAYISLDAAQSALRKLEGFE